MTFVYGLSLPDVPLGACALELSPENSTVKHSLDNFRLGTYPGEFRVKILPWRVLLGIMRLRALASESPLRNLRLINSSGLLARSFLWELSIGIFGLASLAWELRFVVFGS